MYIKLTRLDGTPIWLNAAFIVTIEPRKQGGATVVPIGDGLDYDVCEKPEQVLAMLGDAPVPAVVPVPAPKMLAPTPRDVSPDDGGNEAATATPEVPTPPADETKAVKAPARRRTKKAVEKDAEKPTEGEAKPTVRKTRAKAKKAVEKVEAPAFPDEQIERLRRMAPGSTRKLLNTLTVQFRVPNAEGVMADLLERGFFTLEREHVIWK